MFTGIIQSVGQIESLQSRNNDMTIHINVGKLDLNEIALGDSVATNGVCLTVVSKTETGFAADVSGETLSRTTAGQWQTGEAINLEMALTPTTRLGGHLVSGHVDGVGHVVKHWSDGRSEKFVIEAPKSLAKYIAEKGSICVDGISLTVNGVNGNQFDLNIVPHTLLETTMSDYKVNRTVNLEVDLLARYLERLMLGEQAAEMGTAKTSDITEAFLKQHGFS